MKRFLPIDAPVTVNDYPYGFRLRTTITHSIERKPGHGMRHVTQTVNPKTGKLNKPKASTYSAFVRLYEDTETGHVYAYHFTPYDAETYDKAVSEGLFEGIPADVYPHVSVERSRVRSAIRYLCTTQHLFEGQTPVVLPTLSPEELKTFHEETDIAKLRALETLKREEREANEAARPAHIF